MELVGVKWAVEGVFVLGEEAGEGGGGDEEDVGGFA